MSTAAMPQHVEDQSAWVERAENHEVPGPELRDCAEVCHVFLWLLLPRMNKEIRSLVKAKARNHTP